MIMSKNEKNTLEQELIQNGEINELLGSGPSGITTWGNILLISLIAVAAALTWYIKSPDVIYGEVKLKADGAVQVVTITGDGVIDKVFKTDGDQVKRGGIIFQTQNNVYTAAVDGTVHLLRLIRSGQPVNKGTQILAIVPEYQHLLVSAAVPIAHFGRIKLGQKVVISFSRTAGEPEKITGNVDGLTIPAANSAYGMISISLNKGQTTTYGKKLQLIYDLRGVVSVICGESSLIQKFLGKTNS